MSDSEAKDMETTPAEPEPSRGHASGNEKDKADAHKQQREGGNGAGTIESLLEQLSMDEPAPELSCKVCSKSESEVKLQRCSRCKSAYYCSKECQANDWKASHKKECKKPRAQQPQQQRRRMSDILAGFTLDLTAPHLTHEMVYTYLIEAYRKRKEEIREGHYDIPLFGIKLVPLKGFDDFLNRAETLPGFLPNWWSKEKRAECEQYGAQDGWLDKSLTEVGLGERHAPEIPFDSLALGFLADKVCNVGMEFTHHGFHPDGRRFRVIGL